jgi:hypothetical protein
VTFSTLTALLFFLVAIVNLVCVKEILENSIRRVCRGAQQDRSREPPTETVWD